MDRISIWPYNFCDTTNLSFLLLTSHKMKLSLTVFLAISAFLVNAQNSVGFYTNPNFQFTSLSTSPANISDSLSNIKERDNVFSFGMEFRNQIDRDQAISFNPGFYQMSSLFILKDLQLFDVIHPSLPEIRDQAQASSKIANMHYRFKYLSAQVQYSRRVNTPYKKNTASFEYSGALTYLYLLNQDIKLQTEGFAFRGDFTHIIKEQIYFEGRKHNLLISGGFDVLYPVTSDINIFAGGIVNLPLFTTTTNEPILRHISPGAKVGLRYILE